MFSIKIFRLWGLLLLNSGPQDRESLVLFLGYVNFLVFLFLQTEGDVFGTVTRVTPSCPTHGCLQFRITMELAEGLINPVPEAQSVMEFLRFFEPLNKCQVVRLLYLFLEERYSE